MVLYKFLGFNQFPPSAQRLLRSFTIVTLLSALLMGLSNTFYILFVIDNVGFTRAAMVVSMVLFTQFLIDYPSGSLGDWIGQRWVLAISYLGYAVGNIKLATANDYTDFLIVAGLFGISTALASGALESWLDTNYQLAILDKDPEQKNYGFSRMRISSLRMYVLGTSFLLGGTISSLISRRFVFAIQFFTSLFMMILVIVVVKDIIGQKNTQSKTNKSSSQGYLTYLQGGLRFLVSNKTTFFTILGISFWNVTWIIWGNLFLFPIYFGYSGSDRMAAVLRIIAFIAVANFAILIAKYSKQLSNQRLPKLIFIFSCLFFPAFLILLYFFPINNTFHLFGFVLVIIIMISLNIIFQIIETLRQRILLDLVPSAHRNAIYSLIPTLSSIVAIPLLPIIGNIIENDGISSGLRFIILIPILSSVLISFGFYFLRQNIEYDHKTLRKSISVTALD